ncbi:lipoprotein [human gut metagenome]|uniref:Lipoprotein n=1 Tax=human gut metagenome TaxID=408170 RepID=K1RRQ7_9ZZZZ
MATSTETTGSYAGKSDLAYYSWERSWGNSNYSIGTSSYRKAREGGNARMYHVRITASSGEYTLGVPRITDGKTDPGADNAELVSPSFMIASQLGAVTTTDNVEIAASHCEQYVEVYKDENGQTVHLRDWRLPTRAELEIIINFQYKENAAMDEVLAGQWYWSASGPVKNAQGSDGSEDNAYIRCIRDAYTNQTGD